MLPQSRVCAANIKKIESDYLSALRTPPGHFSKEFRKLFKIVFGHFYWCLKDLEAGVITIEFAIKNDADSWTLIDSFRILKKKCIFIIFVCPGALGTRPEASGTLGIDSTSIEKNNFFMFFIMFLLIINS